MTQYSFTSEKLKQRQHEQSSSNDQGSDILHTIASIIVSLIVYTLRLLFILLNYSYSTYPEITSFIILLIVVYVAYKFIKRIVTFWINMFLTTVKVLFTLTLIAIAFSIYIRGWDRLIAHDLPLLKELFLSTNHKVFVNGQQKRSFGSFISSSGTYVAFIAGRLLNKLPLPKPIQTFLGLRANSLLDDLNEEDINEYVNYFQTQFKDKKTKGNGDDYEHLIKAGFDYLKNSDFSFEDFDFGDLFNGR
ncbi:uncharacterized protein RJT21DRAFT_122153 [Scheffersomyces amazonensis]|uniref:uncharacterized protein n=1 Tax=Scheffersomyces amazonensis TaxID=1078765 RepID=UPI00315C627E